ncbi:MAG: hypothetical protein WCE30_15330 [Mycobacterium sp.]
MSTIRGQPQYVGREAKDCLGLGAVLVRPDGVVAWACDGQLDVAGSWFDVVVRPG